MSVTHAVGAPPIGTFPPDPGLAVRDNPDRLLSGLSRRCALAPPASEVRITSEVSDQPSGLRKRGIPAVSGFRCDYLKLQAHSGLGAELMIQAKAEIAEVETLC